MTDLNIASTGESSSQILREPIEGRNEQVVNLTWLYNGNKIICGTIGGTLEIWNVEQKQLIYKIKTGGWDSNRLVRLTSDEKKILAGSFKKLRLFNLGSGELLWNRKVGTSPPYAYAPVLNGLVLSHKTNRIFILSINKIKILDLNSGDILTKFKGGKGFLNSLAITPDSKNVLWNDERKKIRIYDISLNEIVDVIRPKKIGKVEKIAFSPDGKYMITGESNGTLKIWDYPSKNVIQNIIGHKRGVHSILVSPDNKSIISSSYDKERAIKIWDIPSGELKRTLLGHSKAINDVILAPDGRYIASGSSDSTVRLWKLY